MGTHLHKAKERGDDEFYTLYEDIEEAFQDMNLVGKKVFLPCDSPDSNFVKYFKQNYNKHQLGLLMYSWLGGELRTFDGHTENITANAGGDVFNNAILNEAFAKADCVFTNPPFSVLPKFMALLDKHGVGFRIIAPLTAVNIKAIRSRLPSMEVRINGRVNKFVRPDGTYQRVASCWATNMPIVEPPKIPLTKKYDPATALFADPPLQDYLFIDSLANIPCDYYGPMVVPLTLAHQHNKEQFAITGMTRDLIRDMEVNGDLVFHRIIVRLLKPGETYIPVSYENGFLQEEYE